MMQASVTQEQPRPEPSEKWSAPLLAHLWFLHMNSSFRSYFSQYSGFERARHSSRQPGGCPLPDGHSKTCMKQSASQRCPVLDFYLIAFDFQQWGSTELWQDSKSLCRGRCIYYLPDEGHRPMTVRVAETLEITCNLIFTQIQGQHHNA